MKVCFKSKVFKPPFTPHYDAYQGHHFEVVATYYGGTHIQLKCLTDPTVVVQGCVHDDELKRM